jgi:hypothetical protein
MLVYHILAADTSIHEYVTLAGVPVHVAEQHDLIFSMVGGD